jgi:hypothetical protein
MTSFELQILYYHARDITMKLHKIILARIMMTKLTRDLPFESFEVIWVTGFNHKFISRVVTRKKNSRVGSGQLPDPTRSEL